MDVPANAVDKGPQILIACGTSIGIAGLTVLLRVFARLRYTKNFGADDYCAVGAMIVVLAELGLIVPEVHLGAGRHVGDIEPKSNITRGLHLNFVTQPLCLIALCLTKISVGLFLLRLTPSKRHAHVIWAIIAFTVLSWLGNFLVVLLQCRPLPLVWDASVEGTCLPPSNLKFAAFFNSGVSGLTDLLFALLPIPLLWRVQINRRTKTAIIAILSLGVFATVSAIVKMLYLGNYGRYGDFLYDSSEITIWTTVEICTAIIAASAPCLKPLFKNMLQSSIVSGLRTKHPSQNMPRARSYLYGDEPKSTHELQYRGHISAGQISASSSQERIVPPSDSKFISKTVSVSVR